MKAALIRYVQQVLGTTTEITGSDALVASERGTVYRVDLAGVPGVSSAIVRESAPEPEHLENFRRNSHALAELAMIGERSVAPRLYGSDPEAGVSVEEDCPGRSLEAILSGTDHELALAALSGYADALGRLHASSHAWYRVQHPGTSWTPDRLVDVQPILHSVEGIAVRLNLMPSAQSLDDVRRQIAITINFTWPFSALTHGDPCPDNARGSAEAMRLYDFELARWGACVIDGAHLQLSFPPARAYGVLPQYASEHAEAAYRSALVRGIPEAGDDAAYQQAYVAGCMYWGMMMFFAWYRLPRLLNDDISWGEGRLRPRIVQRCATLAALSAQRHQFEALGDYFGKLGERLRSEWGPEPVPVFPAFRPSPHAESAGSD